MMSLDSMFAELVVNVEDASATPRQSRINKSFEKFEKEKRKKKGIEESDHYSIPGDPDEWNQKRKERAQRNRGYVPKTRSNKKQKRNQSYYPELWESAQKGSSGDVENSDVFQSKNDYREYMEQLQGKAKEAHKKRDELIKVLGEAEGKKAFFDYLRKNRDVSDALHEFKKRQYADIEARQRMSEIYDLNYNKDKWSNVTKEAYESGLISASEAHARHLRETGGASDDVTQSMSRMAAQGKSRGSIGESLGSEADYFENHELGANYNPKKSPHGGSARLDELVPNRGVSERNLPWYLQDPSVSEGDSRNKELRKMTPQEEAIALSGKRGSSRTMFPSDDDSTLLKKILTLDPGAEEGRNLYVKGSSGQQSLSDDDRSSLGRALFNARERTAKKEKNLQESLNSSSRDFGSGEKSASIEDILNLHKTREEYLGHQKRAGWESSSAENVLMAVNKAIKSAEKSFSNKPRSTIEDLDELVSSGVIPKEKKSGIAKGLENLGDNEDAKKRFLGGLSKKGFEKFKESNIPDPYDRFEKPTTDIPGLSPARSRGERMRNISEKLVSESGGNPDGNKIDDFVRGLKINSSRLSSSTKLKKTGRVAVENYGAKFIGPVFAATSNQFGRGWTNSLFPGQKITEGNFENSPGGKGYNTVMNKLAEVAETGPRWAYEDLGTFSGGAARNASQRRKNRAEREFDYAGGMFLSPEERKKSLSRLHELDDLAMRSPGNPGIQGHKDAWLKQAGSLLSLLTGGGSKSGWEKSTDIHKTDGEGYDNHSRKNLLRAKGMTERDIDRFSNDLMNIIKEREGLFEKAKGAGDLNKEALNSARKKRIRDADSLANKPWWEDPQFNKENAGWRGSFGTGKYKELSGGSDRSTAPSSDAPILSHLSKSGRARNEDGTLALSFSSDVERDRWNMTKANMDAIRMASKKTKSKFPLFSKERENEDIASAKKGFFKGFKPFKDNPLSPDEQKKKIWNKLGGEKRFRKTTQRIGNLGDK